MNRTVGRVGGLVVSVAAAAPSVYLWLVSTRAAGSAPGAPPAGPRAD
jgi:hypothetical protein